MSSESEQQCEIQYFAFAVDTTPYCLWSEDLAETNLSFLNSIGTNYFASVARIQTSLLHTDDRQYAAVGLRTAYSHGLETLFALLGATVQAPECVVAWFVRYKNCELNSLIRKIHSGQKCMCKLKIAPLTWESLADAIAYPHGDNPASTAGIRQAFGRMWRGFADEYLMVEFGEEYNSIKHGLRVRIGGFHLKIGLEQSFGVRPPDPQMQTISFSDFGSSYVAPRNLVNKTNFSLDHQSINWNPQKFIHGLNLISMSITNVVSYLKFCAGVPGTKLLILAPADEAYFEEPWKCVHGSGGFRFNPGFDQNDIPILSKDDIIKTYET